MSKIDAIQATTPHPVCIEQVENGYLVSCSYDMEGRYPRRACQSYESAAPRVFQTMSELLAYLPTYFTHRNAGVEQDEAS